MDTALLNGDFELSANGLPRQISGERELIQQILIRLSVPEGAFVHDPTLGSRLHKLEPMPPEKMNEAAILYAADALRDMRGVEVIGAEIVINEQTGRPQSICVRVRKNKETREVSAAI